MSNIVKRHENQKNCLIYVRVSTASQEDNYSLDSQVQECTDYAKMLGYNIVKVTKEVYTGREILERPKLKEDFGNKKSVKAYLNYAEARCNRARINWESFNPVTPSFTGVKSFADYDLNEIEEYIDWQPFFIAWEMHGKFPGILSDKVIGQEATKLFNDAKNLLQKSHI
jgi:cobalamin-dependent methionine synthase I